VARSERLIKLGNSSFSPKGIYVPPRIAPLGVEH
jgi:hypothetical protein